MTQAYDGGGLQHPGQQLLLGVHAHLRAELQRLRDVVSEVLDGRTSAAAARSHLHEMTLRQNYWTLGAFCAAYCRVVTMHHGIEDARLFPDLRAGDPALAPVLDRLEAEHVTIAAKLDAVDAALVALLADHAQAEGARAAVDGLADALLAHLSYEEDQLLEPIARLGIEV